ncbi:hypothetical protein HZH66_010948 [Vespula vulgaris]|uniref:RING-type domain-containing protein n=1 Tax=Vespula vulgaris TaxID=7454 RepID=A0A834JIF1_VESVU|nr:uncharacterized protein LOC127068091 [Vespula vulgaris]KAF7388181.1 hypothetical protein HZH66_010948 [Vespula vulgaris]
MSVLEETRQKWYDILENLLECPVCCEIPKNNILQCASGHHICISCRYQLQNCPICKNHFSNTRNFFAEEMANKLEEIMISLMYPTNKINRRILENKICVSTQTEKIFKASVEVQTRNILICNNKQTQTYNTWMENGSTRKKIDKRKFHYPKIGKGNYPCCLGSCTMSLSFEKIIEHLKSTHKDVFYEFKEDNGVFTQNCELEYMIPRDHDLAVYVRNMGLFFINIRILHTGDLRGMILLVNSASASKHFTFEITIGLEKRSKTYSGMVKTCRLVDWQAMDDCLYINNSEIQQKEMVCQNGTFNCSFSIKRSNLTEVNDDFENHE